MRCALISSLLLALMGAASLAAQPPELQMVSADEAFHRQTTAEGLEGWLAWFDAEAVVFPANSGALPRGLAAIREYYESLPGFPPEGFAWGPDRAGAAEEGDVGYTVGTWTIADGAAQGEYLSVWRRQEGGGYKVLADCGGEPGFREGLPGLELPTPGTVPEGGLDVLSAEGDLAVTGGHWEAATTAGEPADGKYLAVWKKAPGEEWRVVAETGFAHPPAAEE